MSNRYFDFKRFRIEQDRCSMKVGTDGVLLGAWFPIEPGMNVLDVGTGTGLIALMAMQRGAAGVTAVEIDSQAAAQAAGNVAGSEWPERIKVVNADIARFTVESRYDRIVCNPPYFRNSLRCPDAGRNTARHNDSLSYETLVRCSAAILAPDGLLCLVLPYDHVETFARCSAPEGLYMSRRTDVVTVPGKQPKRSLVTFGLKCVELETDLLAISGPDGKETAEYVEIVKDFYLKY